MIAVRAGSGRWGFLGAQVSALQSSGRDWAVKRNSVVGFQQAGANDHALPQERESPRTDELVHGKPVLREENRKRLARPEFDMPAIAKRPMVVVPLPGQSDQYVLTDRCAMNVGLF
jgi:hypothetical protein